MTQADTAIERMIRERILDAFPDHGLVGEEYGTEAGDASVRWYIDPIDGTHNFIRGVPLFGTLLAVERDGELQVGGHVRARARRALVGAGVAAARGRGNRRRGAAPDRRVGGRRRSPTPRSCTDRRATSRRSGRAPGFDGLLRDAWRERGFGDFWGYALVAEGAAEAMIEVGPVGLGRGGAVLARRGGRRSATDFEGVASIDSGTFLATNGAMHDGSSGSG